MNMMDDANIPSLLSIPYLNYKSKFDTDGTIAANTRDWVLSNKNMFFASNDRFEGIGI